jgi:hypothetical protein
MKFNESVQILQFYYRIYTEERPAIPVGITLIVIFIRVKW